ncbi:5649_t:CDS:2 [Cetraspora pellucida]|uniref:5649_t:CDS:1 n=1 Tax=Cetraspora pellucida TaxID=1433469 RepID=A0A9N8Z8R5_9GLOM|nr:5649_t:CDS:2 [Cetraspora pellucida]
MPEASNPHIDNIENNESDEISNPENNNDGISNPEDDDGISNPENNDGQFDFQLHEEPCRRPCGRPCERPHGRPCGRPQTVSYGRFGKKSQNNNNTVRKPFKLINIKLHYLLPNTTAHLQPMDAGIIQSFKSKYKKLYCKHVLNQFESNIDLKKNKLNVRQAVNFIAESWCNVTDITIQNCWHKTGILSNASKVEIEFEYQESENNLDDDEIAEIITDLSSSNDPEASQIAQAMKKYVQTVDESIATEELLEDEEIIAMVQAEENNQQQESDDDEEPPLLSVTTKEVYNAIQTVLRYEEQMNSESNLELEELEFL